MLNIALFVPWITQGRGGKENVGQMMANSVAARDHCVDVFIFDDNKGLSRRPIQPEIRLHHLAEEDGRENDQQLMVEALTPYPILSSDIT